MRKGDKERWRKKRLKREGLMRVHLRDSNRQPQPSRENLEWYPYSNPSKSKDTFQFNYPLFAIPIPLSDHDILFKIYSHGYNKIICLPPQQTSQVT